MGEATGNGGIFGFPKNNQGANNSGGVGATGLLAGGQLLWLTANGRLVAY